MALTANSAVPAIEVRGLTKDFALRRGLRQMVRHPFGAVRKRVLDGVDLRVQAGQVIGVLGANGAGKTTLLKTIATVIRPDAGSIAVHGFDAVSQEREVRDRVAYVYSEERSFYWRLSGRENLEFFAALDNLHGAAAKRLIDEFAGRLAIGDYLDQPFSHYSTGIRQRFALARALLRRPSVLLLDEPTRSVDPAEARRVWALIKDRLGGDDGLTVMLVTHQPEEAVAVCDRIAILDGGKIKLNLPPEDLRLASRGLHGLTISVEGFLPSELPRLRALHGVRDVSLTVSGEGQQLDVWCDNGDLAVADLIAAATASGARVRSLSESAPVSELIARLIGARPEVAR
jgi:ABC-2 type transport system ATP-binding protein